ncbi:hypothetical protein [Variovorax sp. UC122_21]|uniref:hypothetical protein n=1 Tax=Variovorax sp. UC122_21 TaxID=3374554 RepID=UPI003757756D
MALEEQRAALAVLVAFLGVVAGQVVGQQHEALAALEQRGQLRLGVGVVRIGLRVFLQEHQRKSRRVEQHRVLSRKSGKPS